jgi:hypothetical protein
MAPAEMETRRAELAQALQTARPHYSWSVRFDQPSSDAAAGDVALFVVAEDTAGRTWQVALPGERLVVDDSSTIAEEIVETMDDELGG